jgi:hypothetical protein
VIELVKAPVPLPSTVEPMFAVVVGLAVVLQQTPRAVTVAVPAEVTLPPAVAVYLVTPLAAVVVTVGGVPTAKAENAGASKARSTPIHAVFREIGVMKALLSLWEI